MIRKISLPFFSFVILLFFSMTACSVPPKAPLAEVPKATGPTVTVMTYNVENLFDLKDDPKKADETFLPIELKKSEAHQVKCQKIAKKFWRDQCLHWNWNKEALDLKMDRLAKVVRQVNEGKGPDLLFLQEVENKDVLKDWNTRYLKDLGYSQVGLIEGSDLRGIDVAFLSRLPIKGTPQLHKIPFKNIKQSQKQDTRGILQVSFQLPDDQTLTVFVVHFPAPFHPAQLRA
ncbi:MAG: endonuclease/exonuclease/phosphatase family protein, partial [Bdellovibrionales bacterium]|nr:endonuclease/exonuclease/phosphatase family protein [Bdellovibrionales bacterium]